MGPSYIHTRKKESEGGGNPTRSHYRGCYTVSQHHSTTQLSTPTSPTAYASHSARVAGSAAPDVVVDAVAPVAVAVELAPPVPTADPLESTTTEAFTPNARI